jgi:hypothetical protein
MKFVHLECIQRWRMSSGKKSSFYECDQCGFKYKLSRISWFEFLSYEAIVSLFTFIIFIISILVGGFLFKFVVGSYVSLDYFKDEEQKKINFNESFYNNIVGHLLSGCTVVGMASFIHIGVFMGQINVPLNIGGYQRTDHWIVIFIMVLIGVIRSLYLIYAKTKMLVREHGISSIERVVLDISEDTNGKEYLVVTKSL